MGIEKTKLVQKFSTRVLNLVLEYEIKPELPAPVPARDRVT
jgi:hypothetical protein